MSSSGSTSSALSSTVSSTTGSGSGNDSGLSSNLFARSSSDEQVVDARTASGPELRLGHPSAAPAARHSRRRGPRQQRSGSRDAVITRRMRAVMAFFKAEQEFLSFVRRLHSALSDAASSISHDQNQLAAVKVLGKGSVGLCRGLRAAIKGGGGEGTTAVSDAIEAWIPSLWAYRAVSGDDSSGDILSSHVLAYPRFVRSILDATPVTHKEHTALRRLFGDVRRAAEGQA